MNVQEIKNDMKIMSRKSRRGIDNNDTTKLSLNIQTSTLGYIIAISNNFELHDKNIEAKETEKYELSDTYSAIMDSLKIRHVKEVGTNNEESVLELGSSYQQEPILVTTEHKGALYS